MSYHKQGPPSQTEELYRQGVIIEDNAGRHVQEILLGPSLNLVIECWRWHLVRQQDNIRMVVIQGDSSIMSDALERVCWAPRDSPKRLLDCGTELGHGHFHMKLLAKYIFVILSWGGGAKNKSKKKWRERARERNSRPAPATHPVWGQPGLYKTLFQKFFFKFTIKIKS